MDAVHCGNFANGYEILLRSNILLLIKNTKFLNQKIIVWSNL